MVFSVNGAGKECNIQSSGPERERVSRSFQPMALAGVVSMIAGFTRTKAALAVYAVARAYTAMLVGVAVAVLYRGSRQDVYNILWAVVFGFATLNILGLAARRLEPTRRGLSFGELMAVMVVLLSVFLLGWEMLNLFHIFPIKLKQ
jgi:phage-related tail protein